MSCSSSNSDINVLLLGPVAVGKGTCINAFANYLMYDTLDNAMHGELQVIVPARFTYSDQETFEETTITIGTPDDREQQRRSNESCTSDCCSFVFDINGRKLRLIDTPGIGDTRGPSQDEKTFQNILAHINQYKHLNGICVMLKPDELRLSTYFRFCIKELLRHLHKNAKDNLMFIFTNSRKASFQPGESLPLVRQLLKDLHNRYAVDIPLKRDNIFFFDNESFRFLALCNNGIPVDPHEKSLYAASWNHSSAECQRLIKRIVECDKCDIRAIVELHRVRGMLRQLPRQIIRSTTSNEAMIERLREKSAKFLRVRALIPMNDEFIDYIHLFLTEEKHKSNPGAQNQATIAALERSLVDYQSEHASIEGSFKASSNVASGATETVTFNEIVDLAKHLYKLSTDGSNIQAQLEQNLVGNRRERVINLPAYAANSALMRALDAILK